MTVPLLKLQGVSKFFHPSRRSVVHAVNDVTLALQEGETLGLVGESGCGKSTLGALVIGLHHPSEGRVLYRGIDVHNCPRDQKRLLRREMQMVFQDPRMSLDPHMTAGEIIAEGLDIHGMRGNDRKEQINELLGLVGLRPEHALRFPHELSGGQCRRIGIARTLSVNPRFVVCDEPLTGLDASIQAQIINLLRNLQRRLHLTYLFISHDLTTLRYIADRIAVMYMGRIVELAPRDDLYANPLHPYTRILLEAVPVPDPDHKSGPCCAPSPMHPPPIASGCVFSVCCPRAQDICREKAPPLTTDGNRHHVACWFESGLPGKSSFNRQSLSVT